MKKGLQQPWKPYSHVINALALSVFMLALSILIWEGVDSFMLGPRFHGAALLLPTGCLAALVSLYIQPHQGWYRVAAYGYIGVFITLATYSMARWSIDLPEGLLMYALAVVMSSVLLGALPTLGITVVIISLLGGLAFSQEHRITTPDTTWMEEESDAVDAIPYTATLGLVALGSWLSKRDNEHLLQRVLRSEAVLKQERDSLEVKVEQRTRELKEAQIERLQELERFAEFGRIGAGWLHDIANTLAAVSLNLGQLESGRPTVLIRQANRSLRQLERYVQTARRQLYHQGETRTFTLVTEVRQAAEMLRHKARQAGVVVEYGQVKGYRIYGDPVKFNQLVANLIANAIDAYGKPTPAEAPQRVCLRAQADKTHLHLTVQDWGTGVAAHEQEAIFKAFYTTKPSPYGRGLGLALAKRIAEEDFKGSIEIASAPGKGTSLIIHLPRTAKPPSKASNSAE